MGTLREAVSLTVKSMVLGARWARRLRLRYLEQAGESPSEVARLRAQVAVLQDRVHCLMSQNRLLRARLDQLHSRKPYPWAYRLRVLWHLEYFAIPRRQITRHLGIARGTFYRWLHRFQEGDLGKRRPASPINRTPERLAELIWEMFTANPSWGRRRIAMTIQVLGMFIAASTVRNVLLRPRPKPAPAAAAVRALARQSPQRRIPARYPNHLWSIDRTRIWRWGVWPTWALVGIDHFSRKLVLLAAAVDVRTRGVVAVLERAFHQHGAPRHLVTEQDNVFTSWGFERLLRQWRVKHRFGAVDRHGSISVTERVIWTLKYEWLQRVPLIRGLRHLDELLRDFLTYYNDWRPHMTLDGATPLAVWDRRPRLLPDPKAKTLPARIDRLVFAETRVTAYRLGQAA